MNQKAGLAVAREAAVKITTEDDKLVGHGLLLNLPSRGPVVLTCHHVLAKSGLDHVKVVPGSSGRAPVDGVLAEDLSRPDRDVAVLEVPPETHTGDNPLLHVPDWRHYALRLEGIGLSLGSETETFRAWLQDASSVVRLDVPYGPGRYELQGAFALGSPANVNEGISGSPLMCETGIVGLIHFARKETPGQERLGYLNPITAWSDGLPELLELVEPFVSDALRRRADVYRSPATSERGGLHIEGYTAVYMERDIDAEAQRTLEEKDLLCLIGRHNSGKSRLIKQLLDQHRDAVVVVPKPMEPPPALGDDSVFKEHDVFILFDNLHVAVQNRKPLDWYLAFEGVARRTVLILTSGNADDWARVKEEQDGLLGYLTVPEVYLGKEEGTDLSDEEGWVLAERLGLSLSQEEFEARFDGTPGSLLVEEDLPPTPDDKALASGNGAGIAIRDAEAAEVAGEGPHNLPHISSAFVGRESEMAFVADALESSPLVTLKGGPGAGKTRLALEVARRFADRYPDGVWWADLNDVGDEDVVQTTVALAIKQPSLALPARAGRLVEYLRERRALVVLDGAEAAKAAVTALCARVSAGGSTIRTLVTVRDPLGLPWERVHEISPLPEGPTASEESPAVQLFRDRVNVGGADVELSADDRSLIGDLWHELGGNPAAFEIAAAQVRSSDLKQVTSQFQSLPNSRERGKEDALDIAVSCTLDQLPGDEAAVFARLSAFPSWFTLAAARDVVSGRDLHEDAVPDLLGSLVDRALVLIDERDPDSQRYRLIPAVRDVAAEHLRRRDETEQVSLRHTQHYLALAEQGVRRLYGRASSRWIERLIRERTNFRAALRWTVRAGERELGWRLGAALWPLLLMRGRFAEGRRWLAELIELAPAGSAEELPAAEAARLAEVLTGAGYLAYHQADYDTAERCTEQALEIRARLEAGAEMADNLNILALVARRRCEFPSAHAKLEQAMEISRTHHDFARLADQLNSLANTIREEAGDLDEAEDLQQESFALFTRIGSERGCAMAQCDLAYALADQGLLADARTHMDRSLAVRNRVEDLQGKGQSLNGLGRIERRQGRLATAVKLHEEALELFEGMSDQLRVAETQEALAVGRLHAGEVADGLALLRGADGVREAVGAPRPPVAQAELDEALDAGGVTGAGLPSGGPAPSTTAGSAGSRRHDG